MKAKARADKKVGSEPKHGITVSVGYGWNKSDKVCPGYEVLDDPYWASIKEEFSGLCKAVANQNNCRIDLRRLRATYGHSIIESVLSHIKRSQALIFDLAAIRKNVVIPSNGKMPIRKVFDRLNYNVILELGAAEALDIPCLILCPDHLKKMIPSDISGFLIVLYTGEFVDGKFERKCTDKRGFQAAFRSMLKDAIEFVNELASGDEH